jgi:hypothetical protein
LTTRVTLAVCISDPLTPVIVNGYTPVGVVVSVVTDRPEVPLAGLGVNVPAEPDGNPLALKLTVPLNPFMGRIATP